VRIETYQWVTRDFQERIFHAAFVVAKEPPGRRPTILACESAGLLMGQA
jgi:hypothetical protein